MYSIYYNYKLINAVQKFSRFEFCVYGQPHRDLLFYFASTISSRFDSLFRVLAMCLTKINNASHHQT